ncbi:MAG: hypothetical protein ACRCVG_01230 [Methanobacteriaceae archaeon]
MNKKYAMISLVVVILVATVFVSGCIGTTDSSSSSSDYANEKMNEYDKLDDQGKEDAFKSGSYDDYNPN